MNKLELYKNGNEIFRLLDYSGSDVLIISCNKRNMPFFIKKNIVDTYIPLAESEINVIHENELTNLEKEKANAIYGTIAPIIPFIGDIEVRNEMIERCSRVFNISKQTIRHRLCDYLSTQSIGVFIKRRKARELTEDEKLIRKALNVFFYNSSRISLKGAYIRMLAEYYTDDQGNLLPHPSLSKFKRFYYANKKESNFIISRFGKSKFIRDYAPRLSNGVDDYYKDIGTCEVDSTLADIWLVNNKNEVVGRPVISAGICPVTGLCLGLYVGWEESAETLSQMFINIAEDKVAFCKRHGVFIEQEQWPNQGIMRVVVSDRGQTFVSQAIRNLADIGVTLISLEPFAPNYKGTIESFFNNLQCLYKEELINSGVIQKDITDREKPDYRFNACLTLDEFRQIVIKCVVYLNSRRVIDLPHKYIGKIKPFSCDYFSFRLNKNPKAFIGIDSKQLRKILLPRCIGHFRQDGVHLNGFRYRKIGYLNEYLQGISAEFAYNRYDISEVYLIDDNKNFIPFELIDSSLGGKSIEEANAIHLAKKKYLNSYVEESLKARVNLSKEILEKAPPGARKSGNFKNHKGVKKTEINKLRIEESYHE